MSENELDRKDLKILAYKDTVAQLQDENSNLRVELTVYSQQLQDALARLAEYEKPEAKVDGDGAEEG